MKLNRELGLAGAAALAVALPGCGPIMTEIDPHKIIDISGLPSFLPAAVARVEASSVSLEVHNISTVYSSPGITTSQLIVKIGSGVKVSQNEYLTAGHVVVDGANRIDQSVKTCGASVNSGTNKWSGIAIEAVSRPQPVYGMRLGISKATGSFIYRDLKVPDIALVDAPDKKYKSSEVPTVKLAAGSVTKGQQVFFVNDQPSLNHEIRNPNETGMTIPEIKKGLNRPAVYGGVVIAKVVGDKVLIADGLKSYGHIFDSRVRPGASGGGVYTATGRLIGVVSEIPDPVPAKLLAKESNTTLLGVNGDKKVNVAIIQGVGNKMLASMSRRINATPNCSPSNL